MGLELYCAHPPACSATALRNTGFSHSLHLTMPTVLVSGEAPNTFMSRAESHCVGGEDGSGGVSGVAGELGRLSQENVLEGASGREIEKNALFWTLALLTRDW